MRTSVPFLLATPPTRTLAPLQAPGSAFAFLTASAAPMAAGLDPGRGPGWSSGRLARVRWIPGGVPLPAPTAPIPATSPLGGGGDGAGGGFGFSFFFGVAALLALVFLVVPGIAWARRTRGPLATPEPFHALLVAASADIEVLDLARSTAGF